MRPVKRTYFIDQIERAQTDEGVVEFEVEGALEEALEEAAAAVRYLNRLGGAVTIAAIQERTGEIPGPREGIPSTPLHRTIRFMFRYDSGVAPARPAAQPVETAAPDLEPEPEAEPVES